MQVARLGIVGVGTMGSGIAQVAACGGLDVLAYDASSAQVDAARQRVREGLDAASRRGQLAERPETVLSRITFCNALEPLSACDFAVEAVAEDVAVKEQVHRELGRRLAPGVVLASNTSSVSITRLGTASGRPMQFVGMHFFNPVPRMPLVEVIAGLATSAETLAATEALARRLGKTPLRVQDAPGFVANRVLMPMINEAVFALAEGVADAATIDSVMKLGCNHPMGPLALADLIGLDVCLSILEVLHRDTGDPKFRPCALLRRMVDAGRLGRKSRRGFFDYTS
jgi:3-hydroxybutyryl-CoA dehydrogenase